MSSQLELFYFPASFDSQKAYLALQEKNVPFKKHVIWINQGEHNEEWYLRLSPDGQVPALKDGSHVICGSEEIINYVDRTSDEGPCLVPDAATPLGRRVADLRQWLGNIPIEAVCYGVVLFPELSPKLQNIRHCANNTRTSVGFGKSEQVNIVCQNDCRSSCPAEDGVLKKQKNTCTCSWKLDRLPSEKRIRSTLNGLQQTFDKIEEEIDRSQTYVGTDDVWICGVTFTAADITMAAMFSCLSTVGMDEEYYSAMKRPRVYAYKERLNQRPTVKRLLEESCFETQTKISRRQKVADVAKKTLVVVAAIGFVVVVAYGVKRYAYKK